MPRTPDHDDHTLHVRAKATAYLTRTGNADLLPILGLTDEPDDTLIIDGRRACPICRKPLPDPISNGGRKPCPRCPRPAAAARVEGKP